MIWFIEGGTPKIVQPMLALRVLQWNFWSEIFVWFKKKIWFENPFSVFDEEKEILV